MSFVTRADLEKIPGTAELAQLTDRAAGAVIDDTVLNEAIAAADAIIIPHLHNYVLADVQADPDPILLQIARPLARAKLYIAGKPEDVANDEKSAMALLAKIAAGDIVLRVGTPAAEVSIGSVDHAAPDRVFDDSTMADY